MDEKREIKFFSVTEISEIIGISRTKAYDLIVSDDCPFRAVRIGKRICVPANSFYNWYNSFVEDEQKDLEDTN